MAIDPNEATECPECGETERDTETGEPTCAVTLDACTDCGTEIVWRSTGTPPGPAESAPVVCRESTDADQNICRGCARDRYQGD